MIMLPATRRCRHCDKDIARDAFSAHLQHHIQVQERCHLSGNRQYGAFYRSQPREVAQPDPNTQSTEDSQCPIQQPLPLSGVYTCQFCPASFATLQQSQHHQSSGDCTANFVVFWVLVYDSALPRGYRIEERHEPCSAKDWLFKCRKCDLVYATEDDLALHTKTHTVNPTSCEHCQKGFQSELSVSKTHQETPADSPPSVTNSEPIMNGIGMCKCSMNTNNIPRRPVHHTSETPRMALLKPRQDGEVVALSFVSEEDLFAPFTAPETGKFQELNEYGGVLLWDPLMGKDFPSVSMKIPPQHRKKRIDMMLEYLRPAPSRRFLDELLDGVDSRSRKARLTDPLYRKWKTDTAAAQSHILLISGTQCCGKSTLAAGVVADLQDSTFALKSEASNKVAITYFFFDNREENTRTTTSFIRTLIAQLFIQRQEMCSSVYLPHRLLVAGVPDDHLLQALASLLSHFPSTFVVIDGLEMADDAADLVTKINTLIHTPRVHLKLLITARQGSIVPDLTLTMAGQHSNIRILPHEVEENMRSYVKSFLSRQSPMLRLRTKRHIDQLIKDSDGNFFCLRNSLEQLKSASFLHIGIGLKPSLQKMDNPFAERLSILQSHPQSLLQSSVRILQVLRAFAESPSVACLKAVLKGVNVEQVIEHCLQGIVEVKGDIVRFSCPQVRAYLTAGTTSPGTSQSLPLEINEKEGHTTIAHSALECIRSSKFEEVIQYLVDKGEVALNMHESFLALNWRWHVVQSNRSVTLLDSLAKLFKSEQCRKWYMELSRLLPVFAVKDVFDHELWQWLNLRSPTEPSDVDTSVVFPLLENLRSLVLQQITTTKPPEIPALLRLTTSLAYVHADTGYYSTAESLLRSNLTIAETWCPEDNRKGFPLYIIGHAIENGQLVTGRDRLGREKAFGISALSEIVSKYFHRRSKQLLIKHRAAGRKPKVKELDYGLPQHFLWDNTDRPTDSALALVIVLRRQGKFDEASEVALRDYSQYEEDQGFIVLVSCNGGTPADPNLLRDIVRAKIGGLPKEPDAVTAIENLGHFHLREEPPYRTVVSKLYFEAALEQRKLMDGPASLGALKTMRALTTIYLLHNEVSKVHEMFVKFGTPSTVQLREMKPSIPYARLNFALILLSSGLGDLAVEILEELSEGEYDEWENDRRVTIKAMINLAALRIGEGDNEAAECLLKKVMDKPGALRPNELAAAKANLSTALLRMDREEQTLLESRRWTEGVGVSPVPLFGPGTGPANGVKAVEFYSVDCV